MLSLAVIFLQTPVFAAEVLPVLPDKQKVRIGILSKHLRLLKEGSLNKIELAFPGDAIIEDREHGSVLAIKSMEISVDKNSLRLRSDTRKLAIPVRLKIASGGNTGTFSVQIKGESRTYPLPLEIAGDGNNLNLIVTEDPWRYSCDSARAEYGKPDPMYREAVEALSLIILSRIDSARKGQFHRGFDFCDLTHCQVYSGRLAPRREKNPDPNENSDYPPWTIAPAKDRQALYFHARCGGRTLGDGVFGRGNTSSGGVRDWISGEGISLCAGKNMEWHAELTGEELAEIVFHENIIGTSAPVSLTYDAARLKIDLRCGKSSLSLSPEDFRLRVNRVKGWNHIRSNNYTVAAVNLDNDTLFAFTGTGLGHGSGLCQHGALALSRLGYSRYEILEHYYPDITFENRHGLSGIGSPYISYAIFSLKSGAILESSGSQLAARRAPPGSIFKLIVSLYLASNRIDLMRDYRYTCTGRAGDAVLPGRCWKAGGHGEMDLGSAISHSCNHYFASLYRHIDPNDFRKFFTAFCSQTGINARLPELPGREDFSRVLAGLDFRIKFSTDDLIRLALLFSPAVPNSAALEEMRQRVPAEARALIFASLENTFKDGTASGNLRPYGSRYNSDPLPHGSSAGHPGMHGIELDGLWGKTSTVLAGTNKTYSYGIFIGGDSARGIVVIVRKSNGHIAARWGARLLQNGHAGAEQGEK